MKRQETASSLETSGIICLPGARQRNMLCRMAEPVQKPMAVSPIADSIPMSKTKVLILKFVVLTLFTLALGLAQGWASSRTYQPDRTAGFYMGLVHGFLMPATMPGLLVGQDPPIYAANNTGRPYKIGYIFGLNTCGTIFFGISFWQPRQRRRDGKTE